MASKKEDALTRAIDRHNDLLEGKVHDPDAYYNAYKSRTTPSANTKFKVVYTMYNGSKQVEYFATRREAEDAVSKASRHSFTKSAEMFEWVRS